ncbi:tripartite tricarboxylate transporter permease [Brevibacillus brevis]|uniref:tripartite tricarboxylate transporter permease n=1 Tax=Brevibacillus brevis TaxID=1393 RepID=UPI0037BF39D0
MKFTPADEFSLKILGLCTLIGQAGKSITKTLTMTVIGLLLATIGIDCLQTSVPISDEVACSLEKR